MGSENLQQSGANRDRLRFLRYRKEVITRWGTSEEKRVRLQAIEAEMGSLDPMDGSGAGHSGPYGPPQ